MELNPRGHIYCCDFSRTAVSLVKQHPEYDPSRVTAFPADITEPGILAQHVPAASVDFCTMVFVLSAIGPAKQIEVSGSYKYMVKDSYRF